MPRFFALLSVVLTVGCNGTPGNTVTADNGVAACATVNACGIANSGISQCSAGVAAVNSPSVAAFFGANLSGSEVNCLAIAGKDCDAARKCLNNGMTPQSCSGSGPQSCMANLLQSCTTATGTNGQSATSTFDCATFGEMCVQGKGTVNCGLGTCNAPSPATCLGTKLQTCDGNGITHQLDCAAFNATCAVTIGIAHCRGSGPTCSTQIGNRNNSVRCDGSKLVACFDGQEASFDCASIQTNCFANAKGNNYDCALGNTCDPNTFSPTCSGAKLSFCNNGKMDTFDCSNGFKSCDPSNGGRCTI